MRNDTLALLCCPTCKAELYRKAPHQGEYLTDGDLLLRETLHSLDEAEILMMEMTHCWKRGDEACLERILFEDAVGRYPSFMRIYDKLFFKRNENMANDIRGFLEGKGAYFVVVGAGHLVGDKGVPELLRKSGFDVRRQ